MGNTEKRQPARPLTWAALLTALAVLVGVPAWWVTSRPSEGAGVPPVEAVQRGAAGDAPAGALRRRSEQPAEGRDLQRVATRPARIGDVETPPTVAPSRLRIDAIDVFADIVPAGVVEETGALDVPRDVSTVGWYRHGPAPGSGVGAAVLAGHVDSSEQGPGALFRLAEAEPGAPVTVTLADGRDIDYEITARRRVPKDELPTEEIFRPDGGPVLVLITCGGAFDPASRRYADNVVVWAVPA